MSHQDGIFAGQVVVVTGGARGLGRVISRAFAERGAHVVINYFHATEDAPALLAELTEAGHSAELIRASVANKSQVDTMFDTVTERHAGVDVLVNNAASGALLPLDELDESHWQRALDTNLRGSLWCARRAAALMAGRGGGAIVNLSSIGSTLVISDYATIGTAKAAVESLTRYLAVEFAADGIRVNTASGGLIDGAVAGMFPDAGLLADQVRAATPLGNRLGREEELAEVVTFLASPRASWITGQTVVADGGLSLGSMALSPRRPARTGEAGPEGSGDEIAVVGAGVLAPGASTPEELWQVLSGSEHRFVEPTRFDIDAFHSTDPDAEDRTYTRRSGFITDFVPHPALRAELERGALPSTESTTVWLRHCLHTAREGVSLRAADRCIATFGYTADGSQELEEYLVFSGFSRLLGQDPGNRLARRYARLPAPPGEFLPHRVGRNAIAGLLPDRTELVMVDTACSSSLYAIDLGMKALREGTCEVAVCGGAFAYSARNLVLFSKLHGLSKTGEVRPFDREAAGVLFSDGAGVVLLKRLDRARADGDRVLGVIDGVGLSCDGRGKAIYAPNERGQQLAVRRAYAAEGLDPSSVRWVVAHATGTQAGDSTEVASLDKAAGSGPPALLSSNKAIVGHTGWTAGMVSVVQALQGLARGEVPAQRYLKRPIPALDGTRFTAPTEAARLPAARTRRAAVSSFGFGGTNAHLVLGSGPADDLRPAPECLPDDIVVVGWSADTPGRPDLVSWLRGTGPAPERSFGEDYPIPDFTEVRLPPATLRNMDRAQIMLLRAAAALPEEVRAVACRMREATGVITGHMGPTRRAVHYALRCYLGDVESVLDGGLDPQLTERVRALVPPSTEDAFPGIMPNIIPARLASLWDFRGLNLTVDTGPDASLDAVRTAERYLRHGDLDLAVVAGVNGNSTAELTEVLAGSGEQDQLAEGAFVVILARESTARAEGLPVLARVRTSLTDIEPGTRPRAMAPLRGSGRTYLAADGMVALLARLTGAQGPGRLGSVREWGPSLEVDVPAGGETTPAATGRPVLRSVPRLAPARPRLVRAPRPALPPNTVLLVPDASLLDGWELPPEVVPVIAPADAAREEAVLARSLPSEPFRIEHIRLLADLGARGGPADALGMVGRLRGLHDLLHLAAQRWIAGTGDSLGVVLLDAVRDGVPHPAAGPFTGMVKSLARELPEALSLALLTDTGDPRSGLDQWAVESGRDHEPAVVVRDGEHRLAYTLDTAECPSGPAAEPLPPGAVVVAAGGTRGLTAELLVGLAARCRPTVYLLGRSAPAAQDLPDRATFLARQRSARPEHGVAELNAEYDRLRAAAESARTIRRIAEHTGEGWVHHVTCDLTDPESVRAAIDRVHAAHPRVDLLLNAAGVHRGGSVRATSLEQARTVRDTKLLGYLNLVGAFAGRRPHRWVNFGSLLAVLGWPGEADYCSGNDLLGLAAPWQSRFGAGHETTLAWALWDEAGFASEPVTRDLLRGQNILTGLSDQDGVGLFLEELAAGLPDPLVTQLGRTERNWLSSLRRGPFPFRGGPDTGMLWQPDGTIDGYLRQHLLRGVPTLPGAFVLELAAAVAAASGPGAVLRFRDLTLHAPVTALPGRTPTYRVTAERAGESVEVRVLSDTLAPDGRVLRKDRMHARLVVEPGPLPATGEAGETVFVSLGGSGRRPRHYGTGDSLMLSGPFRSLTDVDDRSATATARFAPELGQWAERFAAFRLPVLLVDAMVQLGALIEQRAEGQEPAVPVGLDSVELGTTHNDVALLDVHGPEILLRARQGDIAAVAPDGRVLARLRGLRWSGRPDLSLAATEPGRSVR
ncbi:SDR family oxidoreductase [Amycolatopsis aidingensis]|uniref:SDR family oxidoreductase n=1 Tax=Amycolatopsis aidingensis TaxID=2842453 RepID=UPI001C0C658E|nr:SDR family oxidoreductase [Amycolatopsis aidingensis]